MRTTRFYEGCDRFHIGQIVWTKCGYKTGKVLNVSPESGVLVHYTSHPYPYWVMPTALTDFPPEDADCGD